MKRSLLYLLLVLVPFAATGVPNASAKSQHNILWVVDNADAFARHRAMLSLAMPDFVEILEQGGVTQYKMGITTTDHFADLGHLVGDEIIHSSRNPVKHFETVLGKIKSSATSFWEQGLEASYAVLKSDNRLTEKGVPLSIVYVTDDDDFSCEHECFGEEPENNMDWVEYPTSRYSRLFWNLKNRGIEVSVFPIVGLLNGKCRVPSFGFRYLKVMNEIGNTISHPGSVCLREFTSSIRNVAKQITKKTVSGPIWMDKTIELNAVVGQPFSEDLSQFAAGRGLTFKLQGGRPWMNLTAQGLLFGVPKNAEGCIRAQVHVTDISGQTAVANLRLKVSEANQAPVWKVNPIEIQGKAGEPFTVDLSQYVSDPDGDTLRFYARFPLKSVHLTPQGVLSGIYPEASRGAVLVVSVSDGVTSTRAEVHFGGGPF